MDEATFRKELERRGLQRHIEHILGAKVPFFGSDHILGAKVPFFGSDYGAAHEDGSATALDLAVKHGILQEHFRDGKYWFVPSQAACWNGMCGRRASHNVAYPNGFPEDVNEHDYCLDHAAEELQKYGNVTVKPL